MARIASHFHVGYLAFEAALGRAARLAGALAGNAREPPAASRPGPAPEAGPPREARFPLRLLAIALAIGVASTALSAWEFWGVYRDAGEVTEQLHLTEKIGRIMQLDEVLTMSARMAAASGDFAYERRYDKYDAELDELIKSTAAALTRYRAEGFAAETDEANRRLVAMERRAFALAHEGANAAASALLSSGEYARWKEVYAEGMAKTRTALEEMQRRNQRHLHAHLATMAAASAGTSLVLLAIWAIALGAARRWVSGRVEVEAALQRGRDALELRVRERTAQLEQEVEVRRRAEAELGLTNAVLTAARDSSLDGILVVDEKIRIVSFNRRFLELFHIPAELAAAGLDEPVLRHVAAQMKNPNAFVARVSQLYQHPAESSDERLELADGRILDRHSAPLYRGEGECLGRIWFFRDVTERVTTEEALLRSEERFHALVDSFSDYVWQLDEAGRYVSVSAGVTAKLGYPPAELMGKTPFDIMPSGEAARVAAVFGPIAAERRAFSVLENKVRHKDGREVVIETSGVPIFDDNGAFRGYYGIDRDVTAQRSQERQLREEKEKLRGLVEQNVAGIVIVRGDGRIAYANPFFASLCGCTPEEIAGRPLMEIVPPGERATVQEKFAAQLSGEANFVQLGTVMQTKSGAILDVLVNASRASFEGQPASIAVVLDVTERKKAELALRHSEMQLSIALQMARAGYWEYDGSTKQFIFNDHFYRVLRTTAEAVGGYRMSFEDYARRFLNPEDVPAVAAAMKSAAETKDPNFSGEIENRVVFADGAPGYVAARFYAVKDAEGRTTGGYGVVQDITERKHAEQALERLNRALRTLSAGNAILVRAEREEEFLEAMCRVLVETGGYAAASIGYAEKDDARTVRPVAWAGSNSDYIRDAKISWAEGERGHGPTGVAIRTGGPAVNPDFATNPGTEPWRERALELGFGSSIAFPLKEGSEPFGALTIYARERGAFDPEEVKLLMEFSEDLAFGIRSLRTRTAREEGVARLRGAMTSTVLALASTLEQRDPYTAGHQRNVAKLAAAIAAKLGIAEGEREGIYLAAVVHDIGKIQVPSDILSKPGKLSPLEYQLIKGHAQAGYDIVKGIDFPWPVAEMILQHHERIDGSGYPRGLKGEAMLPGAKILAVADVVEAMMAHRPYRAALGPEAALGEIREGRALRYDAAAVDACLAAFEDGFAF
jgi:PAS domain S-box-containing protein/putative nucleotidyltransferase with HDIG domain